MWPVDRLFCMKLETAGWVVGAVCGVISLSLVIICILGLVLANEIMDITHQNYEKGEWTSAHLIATYLKWVEIITIKKSLLVTQLIFYLVGHLISFGGCVALMVGTKLRSSRWLEVWLCTNIVVILYRTVNMFMPIFTYVSDEKLMIGVYKLIILILLVWILNGTYYLYDGITSQTED